MPSTKRKPVIREKQTVIIHTCTQEETLKRQDELLNRLSEVVLGDGTIEDGLFFMFRSHLKEHNDLTEDISKIKESVMALHSRADENRDAAKTAINAVKSYKKDVELVDNTKIKLEKTDAEKRAERRDKVRTIIIIITACLMICGILVTIWLSFRGDQKDDKIIKKQDEQGVPFVTNERGVPLILPEGSQIKFFPKDYIKKDSTKSNLK